MPARVYATVPVAVLALVLLAVALPSAPAHSYSSGAPPGFSGPEQYCNACHSDGGDPDSNPVNSGDGSVIITAQSAFMPGEAVPVTVTIDNTAPPPTRQGFELSALDGNGDHVGTFNVDGTSVQYAQGAEDWVTHTTQSNDETSWSFEWVAPTTDVPAAVTFYVAGNASNRNGFPDAGDKIYADEHVLALTPANEPGAGALAFRLDAPFPNPARAATSATYTLARPAAVEALLRDGRGRVVRVLERGTRAAGPHTLRVPLDGLAPGAYFLTLSTPEGTQAQPLAVVR